MRAVPYRIFMEEELSTDQLNLIDTIQRMFVPSDSWETAEYIFSAEEFIIFMKQIVPVNLGTYDFIDLLNRIDLVPAINENNNKTYWLLDRK